MADELITQLEAAAILGVERTTLWRWEREGKIKPQQRAGRVVLFSRAYIEEYAKRPAEVRDASEHVAATA